MKNRFRLPLVLYVVWVSFMAISTGFAQRLYVRIPVAQLTPDFVSSSGFIRDHGGDSEYALGYLTPSALAALPGNIKNSLVKLDSSAWAKHAFNIKTLAMLPRVLSRTEHEDYHTYETLTAELKNLSRQYAGLSTLASAGKSVQGRDLWYLKISSHRLNQEMKPNLLYISSMHGDEVVGKELLVYFIRKLLSGYGQDTRITALVDHANLFIMPSMNPDGTVAQQRFNINDVDLNRDFPGLDEDMFAEQGRAPETIAIMELHRQQHFDLALNLHTGAVCFNIPWDSKANDGSDPFGDDKLISNLANQYAGLNKPMYAVNGDSFHNGVTYGFEWYQVLGGMQDWASFFQESTHATLELSEIKWPDAGELPQFWTDNQAALMSYFESGLDGIHLKVTDQNGNLIKVGVGLSTATRTLHYDGYVNRPAIAGSQQVTLTADGYQTQTLNRTPSRFSGNFESIVMEKIKSK